MPKKTDKVIEPIDASFDDVVKKIVKVATPKASDNTGLVLKSASPVVEL